MFGTRSVSDFGVFQMEGGCLHRFYQLIIYYLKIPNLRLKCSNVFGFWIPDQKSKHVCLPDPSSSYPTPMLSCAAFAPSQRKGPREKDSLLEGMNPSAPPRQCSPLPLSAGEKRSKWEASKFDPWLAFQCETEIKSMRHTQSSAGSRLAVPWGKVAQMARQGRARCCAITWGDKGRGPRDSCQLPPTAEE